MHDFLASIGFRSIHTRKDMDRLIEWVLEKPDAVSIVSTGPESNLAQAVRDVEGHAGVCVVGQIDEKGDIIPEYYYPYLNSTHASSEGHISCEKQADRDGFIGMLEDYRMGMALIFFVKNTAEVLKKFQDDPFHAYFHQVTLSALASDGVILMPVEISEKVLEKAEKDKERRRELIKEAHEGDPAAMEAIARSDIHEYHRVMQKLEESDMYTVVRTFFMPYGIDTERYYFMGTIQACRLIENKYTGEKFYRMLIEVNDMQLMLAIHEADLLGVPEPGMRIKCHAWLTGEIR